MLNRFRFAARFGFAAILGLQLLSSARAFGQQVVSFPEQVAVGNIFRSNETVQLVARVSGGDAVQWSVLDFEGKPIVSGSAAVTEGRVKFSPPVKAPGFYTVKVAVRKGDAEAESGTTTFAIVPPMDLEMMPDSPFGIMTHFGKSMPLDVLPLIARAGITSARDEVEWNDFERRKGAFVEPPRIKSYFAKFLELGIDPLMVMAFGNKNHYAGPPSVPQYKMAPFDQAGYEAYTNYTLQVMALHKDQIKEVEIWNEYNGTFCDGPAAKDRTRFYTEMLKHANAAIKAKYPSTVVIGGAMVKIPLPYIEKLFKKGALQHMDGIAVHPYRDTPEGVEKELAALVDLMKKHNGGKAKPIWVTETGNWHDQTSERAATAQYLVRMMTLLRTIPEVQRIYWYLMCDFREFKTMGLVHSENHPTGPFTPTMIYPAYANLIHRLYGAKAGVREETDARTRVYRFDHSSESVWVCWSTSGQTKLQLSGSTPLKLVNLVGGEAPLTPKGGKLLVDVESRPFFLVGPKATKVAELPRPDRIVADSVEDFSGTQGNKNWFYNFYESDSKGAVPYNPAKVQPMTWEASRGDWNYLWRGPSPYLSISEGGAHPAVMAGRRVWAVRRWVSTIEGSAQVRVRASRRAATGDGVDVTLFLDGNELASRRIAPKGSESFELSVTFAKGSKFDVVVTPGPGTDTNSDSTSLQTTILVPMVPVSQKR